jgi:putative ABC transport system permease protein
VRFYRTVQISGRDLISHAFRSALTALGVIFGVGAVIGMMAISEGARQQSISGIEALGIDNIVVHSRKSTSGSNASTEGSVYTAAAYGVTERDIAHIKKVFENVKLVVPVRDTRKSIYVQGKRSDINVFATTPEFIAMSKSRQWDSRGRFICDLDGASVNAVCVIGKTAARKVFQFHDPIDKDISIEGQPFRVIGVFENPQSVKMLGELDLNNQIFIHLETANAVFGKTSRQKSSGSVESTKVEADWLYINVIDKTQIENTAARLRTYLQTLHPLNDYEVQVPYELLKQKEATQLIFTIVMASIAAISLLVGGIGIMNIMMANIYERTKEIGTRRALGAKKRDILLQFLTESVLLTTIGGIVGVGLGVGMAHFVTHMANWPTEVTWMSIIISLGVSVIVGVIFGTYPAWKAANLDPITALRTE